MLDLLSSSDHWSAHARQWKYVKPPLRPGVADVQVVQRMVSEHSRAETSESLQALLLGVTPEFVQMDWPFNTRLRTVDRNQEMIDTVCPRNTHFEVESIRGDWVDLPVGCQFADCVLGDGCFTVVDSHEAQREVCHQVRRVLKPTGCFVIRLFVQPQVRETVDQVFEALLALSIGNFHIFKWRLAMALQAEQAQSVSVHQIWQSWHDRGICAHELSSKTHWPLEEIRTIDVYRESTARYSFSSLTQMRTLFSEQFEELECHVPTYEMGDRCPTLLMRPKL